MVQVEELMLTARDGLISDLHVKMANEVFFLTYKIVPLHSWVQILPLCY